MLRLISSIGFAELQLEYMSETALLYLSAPLGEFAPRNGLNPEAVIADEDRVCELIADWYVLHREAGGDADPAAEAALAHAQVEQIFTPGSGT